MGLLAALYWLIQPVPLGGETRSLLLLVRATAEDNVFAVDRLVDSKADLDYLVRFGGHFFSDRAPGLALLVSALYRPVLPLWPDPIVASRLLQAAAVMFAVLTIYLGYSLSRRLGASLLASSAAAVLLAFGSAYGFSIPTALNQQFSGFLAALSVWLMLKAKSPGTALFAGTAAGYAALVHMPMAAGLLAAGIAFTVDRRRARPLAAFLLPLITGVALSASYNWYIFGAPWRTPAYMAWGSAAPTFLGRPAVDILALLIGEKGILTATPLLVAVFPGWLRLRYGNPRAAWALASLLSLAVAAELGLYRLWFGTSTQQGPLIGTLPILFPLMALGMDAVATSLPRPLSMGTIGATSVYSIAYYGYLWTNLGTSDWLAGLGKNWFSALWFPVLGIATALAFQLTKSIPVRIHTFLTAMLAVGGGLLLATMTVVPIMAARAEASSSNHGENLLGNGSFSSLDPDSGKPLGWDVRGPLDAVRQGAITLSPPTQISSPLVEVRSRNPLVVEVSATEGPIEVSYQWEDLAHRVLEIDTYTLGPPAHWRQEASASPPIDAVGMRLVLRPMRTTTILSVFLWEDGVRLEPFPNYYRGGLAFSFDWETAMGGAIHSRGDPNHDVAGAEAMGMKMREGAKWLGDLLADYGISGTFFATGYNLLDGNPTRRQFVGNPTYRWANRKNGWASDYWVSHPWYSDDPYGDYTSDPAWYFGDLTRYLLGQRHDIQTHTFGHLYVRGTKPEELDEDLKEWNRVAIEAGLPPAVAFSFPWTSSNSVGTEHFRVLAKNGIKYVTRTYDDPYPFELRTLPEATDLMFFPDMQLEPDRGSLENAIRKMEEAIVRRGYISFWTHPSDVVGEEGQRVWSEIVHQATRKSRSGELWIDNITSILDYHRGLQQVRVSSFKLGNTWRFMVVNEGTALLRGVTLSLPGSIVRAEVEGEPWKDFAGSRMRLPDLAPGTPVEVVVTLK